MGLKLYIDYMSQPCRAMVIFLRMNKIPFEEEIVSFVSRATRDDKFAKINPMKRVPAIDDDGFVLTESVAILQYLASKHEVADHWYPNGLQERARFDEYMAWQHTGVRTKGSMVFIAQALKPHLSGEPADPAAVKENSDNFEVILDQMENYYLKGRNYVAGSQISIGDLLGVCELMQPGSVGYDFTKGRPAVAQWLERVKGEIQPHFDDTHREIMAFGSKYKLAN